MSSIIIFEDKYYNNLLPLAFTRPVYDLRCGIQTLKEKIEKTYSKNVILHCRNYLNDTVKKSFPKNKINSFPNDNLLLINGRVIVDSSFKKQVSPKGPERVFVKDKMVAAVRLEKKRVNKLKEDLKDVFDLQNFEGIKKERVDVEFINYPWDLITFNGEEIKKDFNKLTGKKVGARRKFKSAHFINGKHIFIDKETIIKPGCVLDASEGPIYIGKNVKLFPNVIIEGPAFIGENSQVKAQAVIYDGTSIGPVCKVGGELENSIIHSYSNKQHSGFLGHSYLGSWINIGAGTNNSDLKNNYSNVAVQLNGRTIDTRLQFVGLIIGDHSKTSINSMFNTGTIVGVSCNVFGSGFPPKYIPSFSWGGDENIRTYNLEKSIETAKAVMKRRDIKMTNADEKLFKDIYNLTAFEREKKIPRIV